MDIETGDYAVLVTYSEQPYTQTVRAMSKGLRRSVTRINHIYPLCSVLWIMNMNRQTRDETVQCRKLLLDFYSSELSTHSRLIVGFTVILLTILQITQKLQEHQQTITYGQFWIGSFGIFMTAWVLYYLLMRHIAYGILSNAVIAAHPVENQEMSLLERIATAARNQALGNKILFLVPSCLFIPSGERISELQILFGLKAVRAVGISLCAGFAIPTTTLLMKLVGLI